MHPLTSALDGGEWSASRPSRFIPSERALGKYWIRDRVGFRNCLEAVENRKIPSPRRESNVDQTQYQLFSMFYVPY
jgi:hypothetical protein